MISVGEPFQVSDRRKDARLNLFGRAVCGKVVISVNKLKQPTK